MLSSVAAPSVGASVAVVTTNTAPRRPPVHTHHGASISAAIVGQVPTPSEQTTSATVPTTNDAAAARSGWPRTRASSELTPACVAMRAPDRNTAPNNSQIIKARGLLDPSTL